MRIGLITTINTNVGDDFIREGICLLLREILKGQELDFVPINKHQPFSVYPSWHPIKLGRLARLMPRAGHLLTRVIENFAAKLPFTHFDTCNLIVQCGAPVLWPNCHRCEWAEPLWQNVVGRLSDRIPVLNLAAGSCYPWEEQPKSITNPRDEIYLRAILDYCCITTVRDSLAHKLCTSMGVETVPIPCSAFLAAADQVSNKSDDDIVLINYMPGGGHYDWNQGVDHSLWQNTVKCLIDRLRTRHQVGFLCHNEAEYRIARNLDPTLPSLWPKDKRSYFTQVSRASVALCNRMHASVAMASLGIPSVAVGTDTRLLMVEAIGLPHFYVKEANLDRLEQEIEGLLSNRQRERERLVALRADTWNKYLEVIGHAVHR